MKSLMAMWYMDAAVRSTTAPVHDPSAACLTTLDAITRLPTGAEMS